MKKGQTGRTGRRWLRWGGLVLILSLMGLGGARAGGLGAQPPDQTGTAVQVLPRQTGPAVAEYVPGEVVVLFNPSTVPSTDVAATAQVNQTLAGAGVSATVTARLEDPSGFLLQLTGPTTALPGAAEGAALLALRARPEVRTADLNYVRHLHAIPNDPGYSNQWAYQHINAPAAWNKPQAPGVIVAVLDTGLDANHVEFSGRTVAGYDFVNNDPDPSDDNGHGTHVAGTIAAATNNGVGVAGMAWAATILPIKVANGQGQVTSAAWVNGLAYARTHGARVVNMSFGGPAASGTEQAAVNDAWNAGIVVVASAGNSAEQGNPLMYPAGYDNVVAVAATGPTDRRAAYSESNSRVDLAAPGGEGDTPTFGAWILSTIPGGYGLASGTSQAAPHVAGLAALMFSTSNVWTNATLIQAMQNTATDLGAPGRDDEYGYGLINADRAVAAAQNPPPPPSATPVPPPPTVPPAPTKPPAPTPVPQPTIPGGCVFSDVCPQDLFYPYVAHLVQAGAVSGYGSEFRPFATLTRGQACKLAALALGVDLALPQQPTFADVGPSNPFYIYVETAVQHNMVVGYDCGGPGEPCPGAYFRPFSAVGRDQLAKIVVVAKDWWLVAPASPTFADVPPGSPFYPYIETFTARDIVSGYSCGGPGEPCDAQNRPYYRPLSASTRAQAAKILDSVRLDTRGPILPEPTPGK